jgi:ATP-dependent Clp protease ATP-binding subunit ClpC
LTEQQNKNTLEYANKPSMKDTLFSQKLTFHARHSLKQSRDLAIYAQSSTVGPEHLLLAIFLETGSLGNSLLESMGFEKEKLLKATKKKTPAQKPLTKDALIPPSVSLKRVLERAYALASQFQSPYVGTEHLVYSLLEADDDRLDEIFIELEIDEKKIESTLASHMNFDNIPQLSRLLDMNESPQHVHPGKIKSQDTGGTPMLEQYAVNLTDPKNKPDHALSGRENELIRMAQILARKQKSNPLLIGEPGVGKTALVSALAQKIKSGDVPRQLLGKRIYALDLALIVAGTNFRGEFEARLKEIIREASETSDIILFIDEIHTLVGAGNTSGGLDAANIFKPALARGDIQCIGATTFSEFKRHIEKDAALERRFQTLKIEEPSNELTLLMLQNAKKAYEKHHHISIPDQLLPLIVDLSERYIADRFLPDKAFDVLDEAATLVEQKAETSRILKKQILLKQEINEAQSTKTALIENGDFDEAAIWHAKIGELEKKQAEQSKTQAGKNSSLPQMERHHIEETISRMGGIPLHKLESVQPKARLNRLRRSLSSQIIGQKEALKVLERIFARSLSHLESDEKPLGSLLFLGPTGVGKTLTAKIIAQEFFGDPKALIRLDMSEFMERHSVAQILGAPAGYVGYGEGGKLTEQVRRRPFSVVLFDEIEKAHPDVFNLLLQILDEGRLTDAEGRTINFRHTLIILTSNIGTEIFSKTSQFGFEESAGKQSQALSFSAKKTKVLASLKKELRPELLARLDQVVVFEPVDTKTLESIIALEMSKLTKRLEKKNLVVNYSPEVLTYLSEKSKSKEEGARHVKKIITEEIENLLAKTILDAPGYNHLHISLKDNTLVCNSKKK